MKNLVSVFVFVLLLCVGCKDSANGSSASDDKSGVASYTVRGEFIALDEDSKRVSIHHEAIPDFVNREGEKSGMMSMEMSFRIADGISFAELKANDKIEFSFVVEWKESPPIKVTSVKALPADTKLEL